MKIVIAGAGVIGGSVAEALAEEGHDLTVIDCDPAIVMHTSNSLDVSCVEGNAADPELLREAGAAEAHNHSGENYAAKNGNHALLEIKVKDTCCEGSCPCTRTRKWNSYK